VYLPGWIFTDGEGVTASEPKASVTIHYITAVCNLESRDTRKKVTKRANATYPEITASNLPTTKSTMSSVQICGCELIDGFHLDAREHAITCCCVFVVHRGEGVPRDR
jgi:hypothetical protein